MVNISYLLPIITVNNILPQTVTIHPDIIGHGLGVYLLCRSIQSIKANKAVFSTITNTEVDISLSLPLSPSLSLSLPPYRIEGGNKL